MMSMKNLLYSDAVKRISNLFIRTDFVENVYPYIVFIFQLYAIIILIILVGASTHFIDIQLPQINNITADNSIDQNNRIVYLESNVAFFLTFKYSSLGCSFFIGIYIHLITFNLFIIPGIIFDFLFILFL